MPQFFSPQPSALSPQPSAHNPQPIKLNLGKKLFYWSIGAVVIGLVLTCNQAWAATSSIRHSWGGGCCLPSDSDFMQFDDAMSLMNYVIEGENARYKYQLEKYPGAWIYNASLESMTSTGLLINNEVAVVIAKIKVTYKNPNSPYQSGVQYNNSPAHKFVWCERKEKDALYYPGEESITNYFSYQANKTFTCPESRVLTFYPSPNQKDPRPAGAGGESTYDLIAKVTEGGNPKAGVTVTFKVDVIEKTGGHGHHDANRPKGSVPASGVTDANGEIKITFKAPELAGSHTITATCDSCSNKTADRKVDVLVPDLIPISPNPPQNADGSYKYAFTAFDPGHVGTSGGRQRGEYYLTTEASDNLQGLIAQFAKEGWGIVGLNDASLNWGGLYDLKNNWNKPHSEHRVGEEIDISFKRAGNIVSQDKQNQFYKKFCEDKKAEVPFSILHHYVLIPHFHVRLANANKCGRTAN